MIRWRSTRGQAGETSLAEALFRGLAPDGGLYLPSALPRLVPERWEELVTAAVPAVASALLQPLVGDEVPPDALTAIAADALDFPLPVVPLAAAGEPADTFVLELFHGPTLAFKDVGARFMARLMAWFRGPGGRRSTAPGPLTVLVATSGDTGSAVAHAFFGVPETSVVVLYPRGQVSALQERQFATLGGNVRALAVEGTFDDCQRLVKQAFLDPTLTRRFDLTSANSINVGRLLPQAVYYAVAALALRRRDPAAPPPRVVVPSGNFGNLAAGLLATAMGAPLGPLVAATNANDVVPAFLAGGPYLPRPSIATLSNAMDVGSPSNWERILDLLGGEATARAAIHGQAVDDDATRAAIAEVASRLGYVMDPHTAVGWVALGRERRRVADPERPALLLATAHPAKFRETVEPAIGRPLPLPPALAACLERPLLNEPMSADLAALARALDGPRAQAP